MATLGKPILTNRHLPLEVPLRMFKVLVGTKLSYGFGTWYTHYAPDAGSAHGLS